MELTKQGGKRRRLDATAWREVFRRFDDAGLTVHAFCGREGLCASSFHRWRSRVGPDAAAARPARSCALGAAASPFVELGTLDTPATQRAAATAAVELRLELGAGLSVLLVRR